MASDTELSDIYDIHYGTKIFLCDMILKSVQNGATDFN